MTSWIRNISWSALALMLTMSTTYGATTIGTIPNLCQYLASSEGTSQTSATLLNLVNYCAGISTTDNATPKNVSCNLSPTEQTDLSSLIGACQGIPGNDVVKCLTRGHCTQITSSR
ncbi:MAG: hypothetical protein ACOYKZ_01795 [Chlamydiia bacterium]